ncbi:hypothetical protein KM800_12645 [Clostridium tyrobutyricum]|uniref:hypothetical protein n=1 Tax=Clostridium tyrobutyricum TaxID=1519 RepID=UPI001C37F12E|nr:hypothetical protein [Clostridium tyrobutyricum]MBV4420161.1 hypothetical protein [Clostridium tyrobutyricum]
MSEENYEYASDMIDDIMPDLQSIKDFYKASGDINKQVRIDEKIDKIKNLYKQSKSQKIAARKSQKSNEEIKSQINSVFGLR